MDILTSDFKEAVEATAPPLLASAVCRAMKGHGGGVAFNDCGAALLAGLCADKRFGDLGSKRLVGAEVHFNGTVAWLTPDQLVLHPGLADWTPSTLAEAMILPAQTAHSLLAAVAPVPVFDFAGVVIAEGVCAGQLALTFPHGGRVTVWYGQVAEPTLFASVTHAISGDGLFKLGTVLREIAAADAVAAQQGGAEGRAHLH